MVDDKIRSKEGFVASVIHRLLSRSGCYLVDGSILGPGSGPGTGWDDLFNAGLFALDKAVETWDPEKCDTLELYVWLCTDRAVTRVLHPRRRRYRLGMGGTFVDLLGCESVKGLFRRGKELGEDPHTQLEAKELIDAADEILDADDGVPGRTVFADIIRARAAGEPFSEIAKRLGVTAAAAQMRHRIGLGRLKLLLEAKGPGPNAEDLHERKGPDKKGRRGGGKDKGT